MRIDGEDIHEAKEAALDHMRSFPGSGLYYDEVERVIETFIEELMKRGQ